MIMQIIFWFSILLVIGSFVCIPYALWLSGQPKQMEDPSWRKNERM